MYSKKYTISTIAANYLEFSIKQKLPLLKK